LPTNTKNVPEVFARLKRASKKVAIRRSGLLCLCCALTIASNGCGAFQGGEESAPSTPTDEAIEKALTFNDVTLEQVDDEGKMVWKVRSPIARYSAENEVTYVERPEGELFRAGELVYKIRAKRGEVYQNGAKILLKEEIVATAVATKAVLEGEELEWLPAEDLLVVRNNVRGTHPEMEISGNEARAYSRAKRIELTGNAIGTTRQAPVLQLSGEHFVWQIDDRTVTSDRPIQIERYPCENVRDCAATDVAVSDRAQLKIDTKIADFQQNTEIRLTEPPLTVTGDRMVWDLDAQTIDSAQPVTLVQRKQELTFTGQRGRLEIDRKLAELTGGVTGVARNPEANLQADRMTWSIPTEEFEAQGDVIYRQSEPPMTLSGPKAFGKLRDRNVVVTGGNVVTDIIP
jgi:LPS export ABC transporter protein LptC